MYFDIGKLKEIINELASDVNGSCSSSSGYIGKVNGKPIKLTVVSIEEYQEEFDGLDFESEPYLCITD